MPKKKSYTQEYFPKKPIYFGRKILESKAYWALTGKAPQYLMVFLNRRQMHKAKSDRTWIIKNNGQIVFPYKDAKKRYEISPSTHSRTLKQLHAVGFIDINHLGGGMDGDCTTFYISKRWKKYGTPDSVKKEWPKDTRRKGNPKIKNYGKGRNNNG